MSVLNLSRNTTMYASTVTTGHSAANTWQIPILDGYSLSQSNESQTITLNEAGATPVRGQKTYNTALNPVEISFSTYVRPYSYDPDQDGATTANLHSAVERVLWEAFVGTGPVNGQIGTNAVATTTALEIDFANSDVHELMTLYLYFTIDNVPIVLMMCV